MYARGTVKKLRAWVPHWLRFFLWIREQRERGSRLDMAKAVCERVEASQR